MDPVKEATAVDLRIAQGSLTREKASMEYNGSDHTENVTRLKVENEALAEANGPLAALENPQMSLGLDEPPVKTPPADPETDPAPED
jgi:hypothetical protein